METQEKVVSKEEEEQEDLVKIEKNFLSQAQDHLPRDDEDEDADNGSGLDDDDFDIYEDSEPDERSDPDFPVCAYTILNILVIIWGIVGLLMTLAHRTHKLIDKFLQVDKGSLNLPPYFLFASCSVSIVSGVMALIFLLAESASFFPVYPHVNGLIGGLNLMACLCAVGAWSGPNLHKFQRLLEADTFSRHTEVHHSSRRHGYHHHLGHGHGHDDDDNVTYAQLLGNEYKNYWDKLQNALHCCGLEGPHNWIKSACQCIPTSCCDAGKKMECHNRILEWSNTQSPKYHQLSHVISHLWPKNCMFVMTQEMNNLKRDWISFPLILLFFHLIIMFNINYIVVAVRNRFNVTAGFRIVSNFKENMRRKLTFCCKKCKKVNQISTTANYNHHKVIQTLKKPPKKLSNDPPGGGADVAVLTRDG